MATTTGGTDDEDGGHGRRGGGGGERDMPLMLSPETFGDVDADAQSKSAFQKKADLLQRVRKQKKPDGREYEADEVAPSAYLTSM